MLRHDILPLKLIYAAVIRAADAEGQWDRQVIAITKPLSGDQLRTREGRDNCSSTIRTCIIGESRNNLRSTRL